MFRDFNASCRLAFAFVGMLVFAMSSSAIAIQAANNDGALSGPLFSVAPDECWMYSTWSNHTNPDPNSVNHTDQLLAEPEVNAFANDIVERVGRILPMAFANAPEAQQQQIAEVAPSITNALFKKSGCFFVEKVTTHDPETPPEIEGAFLLEIGDDAAKVAQTLAQLAGGEAGVKGVQIGGKPFAEIPLDPGSGINILIGSTDSYLIMGMGSDCVERALQRISGKKTPAWLNELDSRHSLGRRTTLGIFDVQKIRNALLPLGGPPAVQIVNAIGLGNVQSLETSSGYSETEMVSRVLLQVDGKPQGALALFGDSGIQAGELNHIPADSLFAMALSVAPEKVFNFAQSLMLQFSPSDAESMMRDMTQFQQETGVDVRNDIINQIGPTWCLYNGASDGWFTGMALTVSVDEPNRLAGALKKLVQTAMAESDGNEYAPRFSSRMVGDAEIHTVQIPEMPLPFEPSWCISGNRLIVGMFPQSITPIARPMEYEPLLDSVSLEGYGRSFSSSDANAKLLGFGYQDSQKQFEILYPYVQMIMGMSRMFMTEMADMPPEAAEMMETLFGGINLPPARSIHKHLVPTVSVFRQTASGFEAETRQTIPMVDVTFTVPVAIGLLLPAVQQVRVAAKRAQSQNNLKQLALAIHNFESVFQKLPSGFGVRNEGEQPVSWRVMILPYLEQQALYDSYRFDEPWDSEHNVELAQNMPEVYRSPNSQAEPGMTVYLGIGGVGGAMGVDNNGLSRPRKFRDFRDGMSNTILFLEASDQLAVPWTKPDAGVDPENFDFYSLFGQYPGGFNAALSDGSVSFLSGNLDPEILKLMMEMNDGKIIPDGFDR